MSIKPISLRFTDARFEVDYFSYGKGKVLILRVIIFTFISKTYFLIITNI